MGLFDGFKSKDPVAVAERKLEEVTSEYGAATKEIRNLQDEILKTTDVKARNDNPDIYPDHLTITTRDKEGKDRSLVVNIGNTESNRMSDLQENAKSAANHLKTEIHNVLDAQYAKEHPGSSHMPPEQRNAETQKLFDEITKKNDQSVRGEEGLVSQSIEQEKQAAEKMRAAMAKVDQGRHDPYPMNQASAATSLAPSVVTGKTSGTIQLG